eukprot:366429-Chlamydomonas_euryale.AAC.3
MQCCSLLEPPSHSVGSVFKPLLTTTSGKAKKWASWKPHFHPLTPSHASHDPMPSVLLLRARHQRNDLIVAAPTFVATWALTMQRRPYALLHPACLPSPLTLLSSLLNCFKARPPAVLLQRRDEHKRRLALAHERQVAAARLGERQHEQRALAATRLELFVLVTRQHAADLRSASGFVAFQVLG